MFKKLMKVNAKLVTNKPKLVLLGALVITLIAGVFATNLSMELSWTSFALEDSPAVIEYEEILKEFPSLDSIVVLIESDDREMLEKAVLEAAEKVGKLDEYVFSVVAGIDKDFLLENSMLSMEEKRIELMGNIFVDANADRMYEFVYAMMDESIMQINNEELKDEQIQYIASTFTSMIAFIEETNIAIKENVDEYEITNKLEKLFAGNTLLTSPDGKMAMLTIQPTFDAIDEEKLIPGVDSIEKVLNEVNDKYENVTVRGTGSHFITRDEMVSVRNDSYLTSIISFMLILAMMYFAFRAWVAPVFTLTPLLVGIVWMMGIIGIVIGRLNMMTGFAVAMLLGLGVDYSIHMYSSYTETQGKRR